MARGPLAWILAGTAFTAACAAPPAVPLQSSTKKELPPEPPSPLVEVAYREPASAFEIVDNVARWMPEKNDEEYLVEWERRFGPLSADDRRQLDAWSSLREAHYPSEEERPSGRQDLFARRKAPDVIAEAFYGAKTEEEAFASLGKQIGPAKTAIARAVFDHLRPRIAQLLVEDARYAQIARELAAKMDPAKTEAHVKRLLRFYRAERRSETFTVLFVHWPPVENVQANNRGRFLLMKYNAVAHAAGAVRDVEIPMHEIAHWASAHGKFDREGLSARFLSQCKPNAKTPKILEEPLAVAHQKVFLRIVDPSRFDRQGKWYSSDPWIAPFAKELFDVVQASHELSGSLDETFVDQAAAACNRVLPKP
ncbi:MAG: hypothetical protein JST00_21210 [Deltaproteobacteria bacterium]|nr:hypothetical protein [Deltaproteobacteria bacterium]